MRRLVLAVAFAVALTGGAFLAYSRDEEREADAIGMRILMHAGWDGRGMIELFELLRRKAGRDPGSVDAFLSSHPSPADRIARLTSLRVGGGRRDSRRFREIKARLSHEASRGPVHNRD